MNNLNRKSLRHVEHGDVLVSVFDLDHPLGDCHVSVPACSNIEDAKYRAWRFLKQAALEMNQKDFDQIVKARERIRKGRSR